MGSEGHNSHNNANHDITNYRQTGSKSLAFREESLLFGVRVERLDQMMEHLGNRVMETEES